MARDTQLPGAFLFLDESGDPGTSAQSTPVFVIAILHLKSADALKRAVSRARKKFLRARRPRNEVKWSNSNPEIKSAVFDQILREVDQIAGGLRLRHGKEMDESQIFRQCRGCAV